MKKEKTNNNKNNKIISSILAVAVCCQSFVGATGPSSSRVKRLNSIMGHTEIM